MREKITSAVFIAILVMFFALIVVFPKDERASVQENRELAAMPKVTLNSVLSGDFESGFETYLTDNVGFRSHLVDIGSRFENMRGIQSKNSGRIVEVSGGQLVLNDRKIMEVFHENPDARNLYISVLNDFSKGINGSTKMYLMLVPTQIEFDKSRYRLLSDSEKSTIDSIYSSLENVKCVNVYDKLKANASDYIYFRTDHHWTQRGAYLGYKSIMEASGDTAVPLNSLTHKKLSGFLGYLYNQANVPEYSEYADDIEYFEGDENYTFLAKGPDENGNTAQYNPKIYCPPTDGSAPLYSTFMGGDHAFAEIDTKVKGGKTALVIKDSYANAVLPLLTNNYSKIIVIDPRSYSDAMVASMGGISKLIADYEVDDFIIINYVFTTTATDFINNLDRIK